MQTRRFKAQRKHNDNVHTWLRAVLGRACSLQCIEQAVGASDLELICDVLQSSLGILVMFGVVD